MSAVDQAVERLTQAAPALADHVVRYTLVLGYVELIFGALALLVIGLGLRWAHRKSESEGDPSRRVIYALFAVLPSLFAIFAVTEGLTIVLAPEGAAIMRALP